MKKIVTVLILFLGLTKAEGQWINPVHLEDLNNWTSTGGLFEWYAHTNNTPNGQTYGNGLQLLLWPFTPIKSALNVVELKK